MNHRKPLIKRPQTPSPYAGDAVAEAEPPPLSWSVAPGAGIEMTLEMYVAIRVDDCEQAEHFIQHLGRALAALPIG